MRGQVWLFGALLFAASCASRVDSSSETASFNDNKCSVSGAKSARSNDVADCYVLDGNVLRRIITRKDDRKQISCDITNGVDEFKIAGNKRDAAMIYYKKDGDLWVLYNENQPDENCPKSRKTRILEGVKEYKITSNTRIETDIVNFALSNTGVLVGWGPRDIVFREENISDFVMNECFGVKEKSFSSYVAFAKRRGGSVIKIKDSAREDFKGAANYDGLTLSQWKKQENVCAENGGNSSNPPSGGGSYTPKSPDGDG